MNSNKGQTEESCSAKYVNLMHVQGYIRARHFRMTHLLPLQIKFFRFVTVAFRLTEKDSRKRKISTDRPPPSEEDDEVIGPMPVGPEIAAKKRKKGNRNIWREIQTESVGACFS